MNDFFSKLGADVAAEWKRANFSLPAFPAIAVRVLDKHPPGKQVELETLIRDFLVNDRQPFQTQSGFGQPELVVYDDPRFYIQVLFWLEGTTDIHQHGFSGAFHVMAGSSIHAEFEFENARSISPHIRVGDLRMRKIELLETGRTVPIISGREHIHSLFHLEMPSVTVVVRTHHDPGTDPQFTYLPPHLAVDPVPHDALTMRRMQLLDVLERTSPESYANAIGEMLAELDFERGFFVLQNGMCHLQETDDWEKTLRIFNKRHAKLAHYVEPTLEEILRRDALAAMRARITDPGHRFFMALLLNVRQRTDILKMVKSRYPGSPAQTILQWTEELMEVSDLAISVLDAEVQCDMPPEAFLAALQFLLGGSKGKGRGATPAEIKAVKAAMQASSLRPLL